MSSYFRQNNVVLAVVALVAVAVAAPPVVDPVPIVRSDFQVNPEGGYNYAVETGDGTKKEEVGEVKSVPNEDNKPVDVLVARGSYSYTDPEGHAHSVSYSADENGFHAESEDIPRQA